MHCRLLTKELHIHLRRVFLVATVTLLVLLNSFVTSAFAQEQTRDVVGGELALEEQAQSVQPMWRLYNPNSGEHFYTANLYEAKVVCKAGWSWEGVGWMAPTKGDPVYRLYNPNAGDHHYSLSAGERDVLVGLGWKYEGIGWYSDPSKTIAVFRQYNPNARTGTHNFTVNGHERDALVRVGWRDEGIGWYAAGLPQVTLEPFWLEGPAGDKAWIWADGTRATGPFTVAGQNYYGREDTGWVVRGAYITPQKTIVRADRSTGILKQGSLSGNARLDAIVDNLILTRIGTDPDALKRAYDLVSALPFSYKPYDAGPDWQSWSVNYALDFWDNQRGDCYGFSAMMYWLARGLAYDNVSIVVGQNRNARTGFNTHSWNVFQEGNTSYVIDAEMPHNGTASRYNWFMVPYSKTAIEYFDLNGRSFG